MANTLTTWSHTTASYRILFISTFCWTQGFELVTLRWFSKWATTPLRPFLIAVFAWQIRSIKVVVVVAHFATFLLIRNSSLGNVISRIWMLLESFYPFHTPVCTRTTTTISVTRCCNRLKPKYFHGLSKKVTTSGWLKCPKCHQTFGLLLLENVLPRGSKNCPIWSHCLWGREHVYKHICNANSTKPENTHLGDFVREVSLYGWPPVLFA